MALDWFESTSLAHSSPSVSTAATPVKLFTHDGITIFGSEMANGVKIVIGVKVNSNSNSNSNSNTDNSNLLDFSERIKSIYTRCQCNPFASTSLLQKKLDNFIDSLSINN